MRELRGPGLVWGLSSLADWDHLYPANNGPVSVSSVNTGANTLKIKQPTLMSKQILIGV